MHVLSFNKNDIKGWSRAAKRRQRATGDPIWAGETTQKMFRPEKPGTRGSFRWWEEGSESKTGKLVLDCQNVWAESKKFTGILVILKYQWESCSQKDSKKYPNR